MCYDVVPTEKSKDLPQRYGSEVTSRLPLGRAASRKSASRGAHDDEAPIRPYKEEHRPFLSPGD